jgi:release factor glutamine methyltransferase
MPHIGTIGFFRPATTAGDSDDCGLTRPGPNSHHGATSPSATRRSHADMSSNQLSTIEDAVAHARSALAEAACPCPEEDAALLVAHALALNTSALPHVAHERLSPQAEQAVAVAVARRARHEPLAYITGRTTFRGLELLVDSRVLVPVPDTALLVDFALELPHGARVHDVGTGSGAIALAIKHERSDLHVTGSDISAEAITVARINAQRLGLDVEFTVTRNLARANYDLVVANLPYVDERETAMPLPPGTREHQPPIAVFADGEGDGLTVIRELLRALPTGTRVALEHAPSQAATVRSLLHGPDTRPDLSGNDRFTSGRVR